MDYVFQTVDGYVEVFDQNGQFLFSADTLTEARSDLSSGWLGYTA